MLVGLRLSRAGQAREIRWPHCERCGYALAVASSTCCQECGTAIGSGVSHILRNKAERVYSNDQKSERSHNWEILLSWLLGLIGLYKAIHDGEILWRNLVNPRFAPDPHFMIMCAFEVALGLALIASALWLRRRLRDALAIVVVLCLIALLSVGWRVYSEGLSVMPQSESLLQSARTFLWRIVYNFEPAVLPISVLVVFRMRRWSMLQGTLDRWHDSV
jgi:hypothetical protein